MNFCGKLLNRMHKGLFCAFVILTASQAVAKKHDIQITTAQDASVSLMQPDAQSAETNLTLMVGNIAKRFVLTENSRLTKNLTNIQHLQEFALYKGSLANNPASWARFTSHNGKLSGAFYDGTDLYMVNQRSDVADQLTQQNLYHDGSQPLVVFNVNDIRHSGVCALEANDAAHSQFNYNGYIDNLADMTAAGATKELQVSLIADVEWETGSSSDGTADMLAEMNIVDGIFSEQVGVQLSIQSSQVLTNNGPLTMTDAVDLIVTFRSYVDSNFNNPGITHLFTGKNLDGGTIGIAYVGSLCGYSSVGVTQRFGGNTALVAAHEIGHNFGAPHDNQSGSVCSATPGTFLMNPSINGSEQFSDCSLGQMANFVNNAMCIVDIANSPPEITSTPNLQTDFDVAYFYDANETVEATGEGDITFNLDFGPDGMTLTSNGLLSWTPTADQVGSNPVQISATSAYGTDVQNFDVLVVGQFLNFNQRTVSSYGGSSQDLTGAVDVQNGGYAIRVAGNRWKKVDFAYNVTPSTVIEFDFTSNAKGEIHGIGFDNDNNIEDKKTFQVYGSQSWGIRDYNYTGNGQPQRFKIPLGKYYTGDFSHLFFAMDNDVSRPNSESIFSNIVVYEEESEYSGLDFNYLEITAYGGSDQNRSGFTEILEGGKSFLIDGNLWRKVRVDTNLQPESVISFEFRSTAKGEIHGIGFSNSNGVNASKTFQLFGTQNWGNRTFTYTGAGEFQQFDIPVGDFYTGEFTYLIFAMDNDVSNPNSNSEFRNVIIRQ